MKRFIKNNIKVFVVVIISGIVFTGIGVYAASQYFAKDINFTPTNENFKKENGEPITNVEDALNELYERKDLSETFEIVIGNRMENNTNLFINNSNSEIIKENQKYIFSRIDSEKASISFINKKVDSSKYDAIVLTVRGISGEGSLVVGLSNNLENNQVTSWSSNFNKYYEIKSKASIHEVQTLIIDLSTISGEYYLGFGGKNYTCSYQIEKIILIKK